LLIPKWAGTPNYLLQAPNWLFPPVCDNAAEDYNATDVFMFIVGRAVSPSTVSPGQISKRDYATGDVLASAGNATDLDFLPFGSYNNDAGWVYTDLDYDPNNRVLAVLQGIGGNGQGATNNTSNVYVYDANLNLLCKFGYQYGLPQTPGSPLFGTMLGAFYLPTHVMVNATLREISVVDSGSIPVPALIITPPNEAFFQSPNDNGYLNGPYTPPTKVNTLSIRDLANSQSVSINWTASIWDAWCSVSPSSGTLMLTNGSSSTAELTLTPQHGKAANNNATDYTNIATYETQLTVTDVTHSLPQSLNIILAQLVPSPGTQTMGKPLGSAIDLFGFRHMIYATASGIYHALYRNAQPVGTSTLILTTTAVTGLQLTIQPDGTLLANLDGVLPAHYVSHDSGKSWAVAVCDARGRYH